jgi:glycosyltransferase involved in cell wall biosynthesis
MMRLNRVLLICQDDLETLPYHRVYPLIDALKQKADRVDILFYDRCYDKEVSGAWNKLKEGIADFFHKPRIKVRAEGNLSWIGIRRLPLDGILSTLLQDPWIYNQFRKQNPAYYDLVISEAPGPSRVARKLKDKGHACYFLYDDTDYFPGFAHGLRSLAIKEQEICGVLDADAVICVSQRLEALRKKQGGRNIHYIPNGVTLSLYQKAQNLNQPHPFTLIYAGSLEKWAGMQIAIKGVKGILPAIPDLKLIIIGDGPYLEELKKLGDSEGVSNHLKFTGRLPATELPPWFQQADAGLILSEPGPLWEYACPLKLFQYMAAGLPVIATNVGELKDLVEKFDAGITVPYDAASFSKAVLELKENPDKLALYQSHGQSQAASFDWHALMLEYLEIIDNLISKE